MSDALSTRLLSSRLRLRRLEKGARLIFMVPESYAYDGAARMAEYITHASQAAKTPGSDFPGCSQCARGHLRRKPDSVFLHAPDGIRDDDRKTALLGLDENAERAGEV